MKSFREIAHPALILFVVCLIATALLALTNSVTVEPIAAQAAAASEAARAAVLPDAKTFSEEKTVTDATDGATYAYCEGYAADGTLVGFAITTAAKGYGGPVQIMTGVDCDGKVTGIETLSLDETPGLGMRAKEASFKEQFIGKIAGIVVSTATNPSATENHIDALTGASITSNAVTNAVNLAIRLSAQIGGMTNG